MDEHPTDGAAACIGVELLLQLLIGVSQDLSTAQLVLQRLEGLLTGSAPDVLPVLAQQVGQGRGHVGVLVNELPVVA